MLCLIMLIRDPARLAIIAGLAPRPCPCRMMRSFTEIRPGDFQPKGGPHRDLYAVVYSDFGPASINQRHISSSIQRIDISGGAEHCSLYAHISQVIVE